jgi:hypothetical protein
MRIQGDKLPEASKDVLKVILGFAAFALLSRILVPREGQHVLRCCVVVAPIFAIFRTAAKYAKEELLPVFVGGQVVIVTLAALLLSVVPHRPLAEPSATPFGRLQATHPMLRTLTSTAEVISVAALCVIIPLAVVSTYVGLRGGGEHWKRFAGRYPSVAGFTYDLWCEGIVSLLLWLIFAECVWRLTA